MLFVLWKYMTYNVIQKTKLDQFSGLNVELIGAQTMFKIVCKLCSSELGIFVINVGLKLETDDNLETMFLPIIMVFAIQILCTWCVYTTITSC
jgi:hypothetical protein